MKRVILFVMAALMTAAAGYAQKTNMYITKFKYNSEQVTQNECNLVREAVISGIKSTNRIELRDANTDSDLIKMSESEMSANTNAAMVEFKNKGFDCILLGYISSIVTTKTTTKDGLSFYESTLKFNLKVVNTSNASVIAQNDFTGISDALKFNSGDTPEEAVNNAIATVKKQMVRFVDNNFKVKAIIEPTDYEVDKKGNIKTCYISMGSDAGISKGQMLEVQETIIKVGREVTTTIGTLKVVEVQAGDLSLCEVKDGSEAITKAMQKFLDLQSSAPDEAKPLNVVTRSKKSLLNVIDSVLQ